MPGIVQILEAGPFRATHNDTVSLPFIAVYRLVRADRGAFIREIVATVRDGQVTSVMGHSYREVEHDPAWVSFLTEVVELSMVYATMES